MNTIHGQSGKPDVAALCAIDEPGLWAQVGQTFRGPGRWMVAVVWVYVLVFTALAVGTAVMFFRAEPVREQIAYAAGFLVSINVVMILKMWYWMLLNRNTVIREIRRAAG